MDDGQFLKPPSIGMWLLGLLTAVALFQARFFPSSDWLLENVLLLSTCVAAYTIGRWILRVVGWAVGWASVEVPATIEARRLKR